MELISTYYPYLRDIFLYGSPIDRSLEYRGITGSVNIISYLLLMKIPIIYYLGIYKQSKKWWLYALISFLSIYAITVIHQTRSAIILTLLMSTFMLFVFLYNYYFTKSNNSHLRLNLIRVIVLPVLLVVLISNIQYLLTAQNIQDSYLRLILKSIQLTLE